MRMFSMSRCKIKSLLKKVSLILLLKRALNFYSTNMSKIVMDIVGDIVTIEINLPEEEV